MFSVPSVAKPLRVLRALRGELIALLTYDIFLRVLRALRGELNFLLTYDIRV